jgi:hypothetical protein
MRLAPPADEAKALATAHIVWTSSATGEEQKVALTRINACNLCLELGHEISACPKVATINKVRANLGYDPIEIAYGEVLREDKKTSKSVEMRLDTVEKDVGSLRSSVGQLKARVDVISGSSGKGGSKRKADDEAGGSDKKKPKTKKKAEEKKTEVVKASDDKSGEGKKKKKRGKGKGKGKKEATVAPST